LKYKSISELSIEELVLKSVIAKSELSKLVKLSDSNKLFSSKSFAEIVLKLEKAIKSTSANNEIFLKLIFLPPILRFFFSMSY